MSEISKDAKRLLVNACRGYTEDGNELLTLIASLEKDQKRLDSLIKLGMIVGKGSRTEPIVDRDEIDWYLGCYADSILKLKEKNERDKKCAE